MDANKSEQINRTQLLDVDKVLKQKNPRLYKRLPKFIIRYIKRIIRQDELNAFIKANNHLPAIDFLRNSFSHFKIDSICSGEENLPENGKVIFASNHPIGSFDGLHIIDLIYSKYGRVKAVVNDLLLNVKNLNDFFLGVNKHGLTAREYIKELNAIFDSDIPVFFFPSGFVSRKSKGLIEDKEWKKTFITRAVKHKRDVIPIYTEGELTKRFYRIAYLRHFWGIKANLEMFLLPDELVRQKGKTLEIKIGKPISYKVFDHSFKTEEWAQKIRDHVYSLKENIHSEFLSS